LIATVHFQQCSCVFLQPCYFRRIDIEPPKQLCYTALRIFGHPKFGSYDLGEGGILSKLAIVNIFVGANNSGKSRFLRGLFQSSDLHYKTNFFRGNEFRNFVCEQRRSEVLDATFLKECEVFEFDCLSLSQAANGFFSPGQNFHPQLKTFVREIKAIARRSFNSFPFRNPHFEALVNQYFAQWETAVETFKPVIGEEPRFYIPILRGMRSFGNPGNNEYWERTTSDYFPELRQKSNNDPLLFTGLELYTRLKNQLLGEPEQRDSIRQFEEFLKAEFFDNKPVTLIPREGKDVVHVKIGKEKQLPIHQLGDGLQNLIIITYEIFMQRKRCLFFIEEPDLSMHPGMQRALLDVMTKHDQHQYFLTTHSNHLLDMSSEFKNTSIYLFSKEIKNEEVKFNVQQASSPDTNILRELGVHNSSVFLTNATIWVEGLTDRLYLRAFLRKYLQHSKNGAQRKLLREDYHYSFVEYQGSNLTHWTFDEKDQSSKIKANYLCGHSFLLADGDVSEKGSRAKDYKAMLEDRFFILSCKEIENLIPAEIVRELVKEEFEKAGKAKDFEKIAYEKYSTSEQGLGKYLDRIWGAQKFAAENGTLKNKVNFCERAVSLMSEPSFNWQLTAPINDLCEKVYEFILKQNS
jgi:hypothetical protein